MKKLLSKCKENHVTFSAALHTALSLGLAQSIKKHVTSNKRERLGILGDTLIDFRRLSPGMQNIPGHWSNALEHVIVVDTTKMNLTTEFWQTSRTFLQNFRRAVATGKHYLYHYAFDVIVKIVYRVPPSLPMQKRVRPNYTLSNMGIITLQDTPGTLSSQIRNIRLFVNQVTPWQYFTVVTTTFKGKLSISFSFGRVFTSEETANELANSVLDYLYSACN